MRLRNLFEAFNKEVAIIFGRFNPPHKGHRAAWELASKSPIWYVGTNQSTVGPKDPLPYDVKVEAMKAIWPEVEGHIIAEVSWLTLASLVYEKHGDVTLLCLTDEDWVTKTIVQYNGKEGAHGFYNFKKIEQKPTPRLSSATALRDAVTKGDREAFAQAAGVSADTPVAGKPFFDLVAEYLLPYQNAPVKKVAKKKVAAPVEGMAESRMSAAVRLARAADRQRAKSDASLARTPSSIPKKEEPKKQGVTEGSDGWIGNPAKWKEAVLQAHGPDVVFKNYSHPGQPGKRSVNAWDANGKIVGVYQRHNKMGMVQPNMQGVAEFAPPGSSDGGNDGFSEETLKRLAAQWWNGDEDPRVEQTLMSAGWEIGQDEGYDNGGAFVVQAGDINGNSYISWPAEELEGVAEGAPIVVMPRADRLKKPEPTKVRYQGDIVPPSKPPSTEKRGVKGRPGQRPMPKYDESTSNTMANTASRLANKDDGKVAKLRAAGDKRRDSHYMSTQIAKNDRTSKDQWGNIKKEAEGDPEGLPHLTKEMLSNIVQQVGKEGAHAIIKSLTWGDGAAKELLHLIVNDLEDDLKTYNFKKEDAAGVGIITKQNSTVDVNKGTPRKNLKAFRLVK